MANYCVRICLWAATHLPLWRFGRASVHFRLCCRIDKYCAVIIVLGDQCSWVTLDHEFTTSYNLYQIMCFMVMKNIPITLPTKLRPYEPGQFWQPTNNTPTNKYDSTVFSLPYVPKYILKRLYTSYVVIVKLFCKTQTYFTFPCHTYVDETRGVKNPSTFCFKEVVFYLPIFYFNVMDSKVFCSSYGNSSTIRP